MGLFDKIQSGFDRVEFNDKDGVPRRLSRSEFDALPLDQRALAIMNARKQELRFYRGAHEVPMKEALGDR